MPYSLWSRGRLFGHSELAYAQWASWLRAGDFEPSERGHRLMPVILGVGPALSALYDVAESAWRSERAVGETERSDDWPASVKCSSEFADAMSLQDEVESLALELRDPDGNVVPTESIWIQDTHRLLARAREGLDLDDVDGDDIDALDLADDDELGETGLELDDLDMELDEYDEFLEPEFPRYQLFVTLAGVEKAMLRRSRPDR